MPRRYPVTDAVLNSAPAAATPDFLEKPKPFPLKVTTSDGWELTIPLPSRLTRKAVLFRLNGEFVRAAETATILESVADAHFVELKELVVGLLRMVESFEDALPDPYGPQFGCSED